MSYVYKPIDLVELESDYNAYVVFGAARDALFLKNAKELKQLLQQCGEDDDELLIYALQSVARAEKVKGSDDYDDDDDDDYDDDENSNSGSGDTTTDINKTIDEITQTFNSSLKAIISKIK